MRRNPLPDSHTAQTQTGQDEGNLSAEGEDRRRQYRADIT